MTTEEKINQLQAQIDELRKEVKPKFEVGKWYKHYNALSCYKGNSEGYGVSCNDIWSDNLVMRDVKRWQPATDKEVEEALIKEAERRGFKEGAKFKCLELGKIREYKQYNSKDWGTGKNLSLRYFSNGNHLFCDDGLWNKDIISCSNPSIFRDGKWAEIIKDEPVKVGGVECVFDEGGVYFDGNQYYWEEIHSLVRIFKNHSSQLKSINVGCSGQYNVDLELLEKILALKK